MRSAGVGYVRCQPVFTRDYRHLGGTGDDWQIDEPRCHVRLGQITSLALAALVWNLNFLLRWAGICGNQERSTELNDVVQNTFDIRDTVRTTQA